MGIARVWDVLSRFVFRISVGAFAITFTRKQILIAFVILFIVIVVSEFLTLGTVIGTLALLLVTLVFAFFILRQRDRSSDLAHMVSTLGFQGFSFQRGDLELTAALAEHPLLTHRGNPSIWNVIRGSENGRDIAVFDYAFLGVVRDDYPTQTVVVFRLPEARLPTFDLRPKSFGTLFTAPSIHFADAPGFSARYVLLGSDEQALRALFQPRVLGTLGTMPEGWVVQGQGEWLAVYRLRKRMAPRADALRDMLDGASGVFARSGKTESCEGKKGSHDQRAASWCPHSADACSASPAPRPGCTVLGSARPRQ